MPTTIWLSSGEARVVSEDYDEVARRLRAVAADPGGLVELNDGDGPVLLAVAFVVGVKGSAPA